MPRIVVRSLLCIESHLSKRRYLQSSVMTTQKGRLIFSDLKCPVMSFLLQVSQSPDPASTPSCFMRQAIILLMAVKDYGDRSRGLFNFATILFSLLMGDCVMSVCVLAVIVLQLQSWVLVHCQWVLRCFMLRCIETLRPQRILHSWLTVRESPPLQMLSWKPAGSDGSPSSAACTRPAQACNHGSPQSLHSVLILTCHS